MLRDNYPSDSWFHTFPDTAADYAAWAIIDWAAAFGVLNGLMSDGPTHFKGEKFDGFRKDSRSRITLLCSTFLGVTELVSA